MKVRMEIVNAEREESYRMRDYPRMLDLESRLAELDALDLIIKEHSGKAK